MLAATTKENKGEIVKNGLGFDLEAPKIFTSGLNRNSKGVFSGRCMLCARLPSGQWENETNFPDICFSELSTAVVRTQKNKIRKHNMKHIRTGQQRQVIIEY